MRRTITLLAGVAAAALLTVGMGTAASAATLRPCLPNHHVKVVKGHATMVVNGHTVQCKVVKKTTKRKPVVKPAKPTPSPTATADNPPMGVIIRFAGDAMNSLTVHAGLTVTLRNADAVPHTLVISSAGISVTVPANDISAFLAPTTPGTYAMTTSENPSITGVLVVVP